MPAMNTHERALAEPAAAHATGSHSGLPPRSAGVPASPCTERWNRTVTADLRSDHAGETGAVQIYRGVLAVARDPAVRRFAEHHLATEQQHLDVIDRYLRPQDRSRLLPAWRVAGWLTGALPALFGPRMVYATIASVETFVDTHYAEQLHYLDAHLQEDARYPDLRRALNACREDEVHHRDEALAAGPAQGWLVQVWTWVVATGSKQAVVLARRV